VLGISQTAVAGATLYAHGHRGSLLFLALGMSPALRRRRLTAAVVLSVVGLVLAFVGLS
jgi:hypothetical protein